MDKDVKEECSTERNEIISDRIEVQSSETNNDEGTILTEHFSSESVPDLSKSDMSLSERSTASVPETTPHAPVNPEQNDAGANTCDDLSNQSQPQDTSDNLISSHQKINVKTKSLTSQPANNSESVNPAPQDVSVGNNKPSTSTRPIPEEPDSREKIPCDQLKEQAIELLQGSGSDSVTEDNMNNIISSADCTSFTSSNNARRNGSRRVYFPGGSVVSGYMDPPSPWIDVTTCSTEDLLTAYKKACEKLGSKPLPRLLSQLHAITDFCDRNETLSLRGDKLDQKHCETLEEILRRVQFRTLDLEATHLEEEGAIALFDMVEYYESATRLNISYNRGIGPRGWQSCARMLKKTPCLEHLEARNCQITEQIMPMLGRALRLGSMLATLHLENCMLAGRPLMILVAAIKMNDTLRELFLADNKLMPSDGIQLGNMLKLNHTLHVLDVRNNHLQDMGLSHICDGLSEQTQGKGLNTFVLWNNQITYQSMQALSHSMARTKQIETLNLGHNNLGNEGIHRLKDGLLQNKSLLRLGLQAAKIYCEGAVALAEYIAESPRLLRVDLRENEVKTGGLMALALSLKVSKSVSRVDLDRDPKRESGVKDYAEQQRRLLADIMNYMHRNREMARLKEEAEEEEQQRKLEQEMQEQEQRDTESQKEQTTSDTIPGADKTGMTLPLCDPLTQRSQTLESPGFVTQANMPIVNPPIETQQAKPLVVKEKVPVGFPPSPMVISNGRPMLAHVTEGMNSFAVSPQLDLDDETNLSSLSSIREETKLSSSGVPFLTQEVSPDEVDIFVKGAMSHTLGGGDTIPEHLKDMQDSKTAVNLPGNSAATMCDNGVVQPVQKELSISKPDEDSIVVKKDNKISKNVCDTKITTPQEPLAELKTNLTQNGMCNELASIVDSLDKVTLEAESTISEDVLSSPDEFERELDAMLANVQPTLVIQAPFKEDIPETSKDAVTHHPLS